MSRLRPGGYGAPGVHVTFTVPGELRGELKGLTQVPLGYAEGALTLLTDRIDAAWFDRAPKLRVVSQMAAGTDNIDGAEAARRGIAVANTPDVLTGATADCAFALILACARGVVKWDRAVREGKFAGWKPFEYLGHDVHGATLGIVGRGRIGRAVAERGRGFGMKVVFATRKGGLDRALACDFVSLHTPLTPETRHMIGRAQLRRMKPGAYLINTARGPVVDEAALVEALEKRWIAGAGLDVYEREPEVHPGLLKRDDVVLLPHVGSATHETRAAMFRLAVRNLRAALRRRILPK
jgi:glyoxylate reductase